VLETRELHDGTLMRRMRVCANDHKFPTFELPGSFYSRVRGTLQRSIEGRARARRLVARDAEIRRLAAAGHANAELAARYKLHITRVRQIMKGKR